MTGELICSVITPHTPRMGVEDSAPEFVRGLIDGGRELGDFLRSLEPDLIVIKSAHWVCTFNWYVTAHQVHQGNCVANEAPDLIPGLPYRHPGDPEFAKALVAAIKNLGLPCFINDTPHFTWDYANYVPLKYISPEGDIPVVQIPTCLSADFDECRRVGREVANVASATGRRVVFIASSALSHAVVRGPETWPTEERKALDFKFLDMLDQGRLAEAIGWFPDYCREAVAEMGGKPIAGFLGSLESFGDRSLQSRRFGLYCQSSGSGNMTVAYWPS